MVRDNRGLTMVELIIAIAVAVIIIGASALFLHSAQKGYNNAVDAIDLQTEAQLLMEQLGTWVMESNGAKVDGTVLVIYEIPRETLYDASGETYTENAVKRVIWQADGKLYMEKSDITRGSYATIADAVAADTVDTTALSAEEKNCIGEYVSAFTPRLVGSTDASAEKPGIGVSLTLTAGKSVYEIEDEFTVRNDWRL